MLVLIDADPIVYASAAAAESRIYELIYRFTDRDGDMCQQIFEDGHACQQFQRDYADYLEVFEKNVMQDPEPVSHALQNARTQLDYIRSAIAEEYDISTNQLKLQVFLTGNDNFREKLATIREYKGHRKDMLQPVHKDAVRDYLATTWQAKIINGIEADDAISIMARQEPGSLIVSIDKDLDQIPGTHYNYKNHEFYDITPIAGEMFFYHQVLTGDATDNIQGLVKIGKRRADKLMTGFDGWEWIVDLYADNMKEYPDKYPEDMTAEEAALENARLVYMLHEEDELWLPGGHSESIREYLNDATI